MKTAGFGYVLCLSHSNHKNPANKCYCDIKFYLVYQIQYVNVAHANYTVAFYQGPSLHPEIRAASAFVFVMKKHIKV